MEVMKNRPPHVIFETRAVQNRTKTIASGVPVYDNVNYAQIYPAGSKDCHEKIAEDWLKQIKNFALEGKYDPQHLSFFELRFAEFLKGNELPENGTPIKMWPQATPADIAQLQAAKIYTVEDLAALPESGFGLVGMNARVMKEKALAWLGAGDKGKQAEQIAALQVAIRDLTDALQRETDKRKELEAELKEQPKKKAA